MYHTIKGISKNGSPITILVRNVTCFGPATGEINGIKVRSELSLANGERVYSETPAGDIAAHLKDTTDHLARPSIAAYTWLTDRMGTDDKGGR